MSDAVRYVYCPGCDIRILPGQSVRADPANPDPWTRFWHSDCRHRHLLPAVQAQIADNLDAAYQRHVRDTRLDDLRRRIVAIGGQLAGQGGDEGVIDSDSVWHDIEESPDAVGHSADLDAIEKIIAGLEAIRSRPSQ